MQKALNEKAVMISFFSLILIVGFVLTAIRSADETNPDAAPVATIADQAPETVPPAVESTSPFRSFIPEATSVVLEEPAADYAFFLPEREKTDIAPAEAAPPVTRNGESPVHETETKTMPVFPESEPVLVARKPCLKKQSPPATSSTVENTTWVPFVYYYRRTAAWCPAQLYVYPLVNCPPVLEENDTETKEVPDTSKPTETGTAEAMPNTLVPVFYVFPIYPISQRVFVPNVVPGRHGAPKLVYPNGVVVKPKVYVPGQPLKNAIRAVTP